MNMPASLEPLSRAAIDEEVKDFIGDLEELQHEVRRARTASSGKDKTHYRFVGDRIERALQELRRID